MAEDLFQLFAEYSGMPVADIQKAAADYGLFNQYHWSECTGKTWEERASEFYGIANGYIFDLLNSNRSREHLLSIYQHYGHWPWLRDSGHEVLEFGGGLGLTSSIFRELGRRVTYVDVDGPVSRFARWYFERTGQQDIEMIMTPPETLVLPAGREWDFIFSDSVIEHLVDPEGTVDTLARAVRPGGILYLIIDAHNVDPRFPMHRHIHLADLLAKSPTLAAMDHLVHEADTVNVFRNNAMAEEPGRRV
jgi:2-polyprenyl-3-methyl-5-hydroxy-6-metoxy-1,4-benzoquinol methylase